MEDRSTRWLFSKEQLKYSPSRKWGLKSQKEFSFRQQATFFLQDMGLRLHISQFTINTAIVYTQRFYMVHSFTKWHKNDLCPAALFLATKVEEEPQTLEDIIKVCFACLKPGSPPMDIKSQAYKDRADQLLYLETILLKTLGFDVSVEHPHASFNKIVKSLRTTKTFKRIFYLLANNSLLTTLCLQYKPSVIACMCAQVVCKCFRKEVCIPSDNKLWWKDVDLTVTSQLLDEVTNDYLEVLNNIPYLLPKKAKGPDISDLNAGILASLTPSNGEELTVLNTVRMFYADRNPASFKPLASDKPTCACRAGTSSRKRSYCKEVAATMSKVAKMKD